MRLAGRIGGVATGILVLALSAAGVASAHVTAVSPDKTVKGGDAVITFRVPDEDDAARTTKFTVTFPASAPVLDADTTPVPGWTAEVATKELDKPLQVGDLTVKEVVSSVTWTAQDGTGIAPGQFQQFSIAVEGLPSNVDQLVMPATQTYDSGKVVNWGDQPPAPGAQEPEHPAPHLTLAADAAPAAAVTTPMVMTSQDDGARWLGGGALLLAALALGVGIGALLRRRPKPAAGFVDDEEPVEAVKS
ncbi:YcnI family protein [Kutzneria sp. 744]|uniref:YcnI family copper-binding membrane protein n=1 Tax=Kutzneria sp. (strain 744) TaxID=345341 RepID=UPI0003EEAB92|nr:YcnI family protein [Kutzneria sp. 744]EWM19035.1 nuclear export factor GLE1 [Kutzneria sp. 744]